MIKKFIQGHKTASKELYGNIGHWLVSKEMHELLGMPITAEPEDIWYVSFTEEHEPNGFLELRIMKNKKAHIRYCYADKETVRTQLIKHTIKMLSDFDIESTFTNDHKTDKTWPELGFKKHIVKNKGEFCRWEKEL